MKKRLLSLLSVSILAVSLLAGCSTDTDAEKSGADKEISSQTEKKKLTKVTLNEVAHSIFYAPMYVAIEENYFREEGIDLELVCGFGDNMLGKDTLKKPRICVV